LTRIDPAALSGPCRSSNESWQGGRREIGVLARPVGIDLGRYWRGGAGDVRRAGVEGEGSQHQHNGRHNQYENDVRRHHLGWRWSVSPDLCLAVCRLYRATYADGFLDGVQSVLSLMPLIDTGADCAENRESLVEFQEGMELVQ